MAVRSIWTRRRRLRQATTRFLWLCMIILLAAGCGGRFVVKLQTVTGTFTGVTPDGHPIVLTMEQAGQVFRGVGTIAGAPIVMAGPLSWSAVGSLSHADGSVSTVTVRLSADSEVLTLARLGQPDIVLNRGGTPVQFPPGPFSGRYRAVSNGTILAEATIVQSGLLVSGVGVIAGDPAGIHGRVIAPRKLTGVMTFLDESRVLFDAELAADDQSLRLQGFGRPLDLRKR